MTLAQQLFEYIAACFTGVWVESHEHDDALVEIAQLCRQHDWRLAVWDVDRGLQITGQAVESAEGGGSDPLAAIRSINALASPDSSALLVLPNFHRLLHSAELIQALAHQISTGKHNRTFVVVLSPVVQIPTELEKQFVVLEHRLPDRQQLDEIARGIAVEQGELPDQTDLQRMLDAATGLTRYECEGAFALSVVRHGQLRPEAVWELKSGMLKKSGLLSLHRGKESFDRLGGLDVLKSFCLPAMRKQGSSDPLRRPRGVMLLSPPGCGKSEFCKSLGNETGRPTLILDVGSLMGSLVGQSEERTRKALHIVDAMAPCVVMIDEVEKALSGVASSGHSDSGVSARMFGTLLSWLNDHESDVFVVCTCNDISKLPPEFSRAERFDGVFFVDLPTPQQRKLIWAIYMGAFQLDASQPVPTDENWTGAEIRACCRLAALLDVPLKTAAQNVVPIAVTAAESVERLRNWASGRCLSADKPGIYACGGHSSRKTRRRIPRDPSVN